MRNTLLVVIGVLSLVTPCYAKWPLKAKEWVKAFNQSQTQYGVNSKAGSASTVWAAAQSYRLKLWKPNHWIEAVPSPAFQAGEVAVNFSLQMDDHGHALRRPLLIFLPGVFGGVESPSVLRAISNFTPRGYHVVAIPNPWSRDYLQFNPHQKPGYPEEEGRTVLGLIRTIKEYIGEDYISRTEILGESYGGFLSVVTASLDQQISPSINGPVSAFGPPLDRVTAMQNLDIGYEKSKDQNLGHFHWRKHLATLHLFLSPTESGFFSTLFDCGEPIFYQNFQSQLVQSAQLLHQKKGLGPRPHRDLKFSEFLKVYAPENLENRSFPNDHTLLEWVKRMPPHHQRSLRIMTATDDILNDTVPEHLSWKSISEVLHPEGLSFEQIDEPNLLILSTGGHIGFLGLSAIQEFFDSAFFAEDESAIHFLDQNI